MMFTKGTLCMKELGQEKARPTLGTRETVQLEERVPGQKNGSNKATKVFVVQIMQDLVAQIRAFGLYPKVLYGGQICIFRQMCTFKNLGEE